MRQHHALRRAAGARGVDDAGGIVGDESGGLGDDVDVIAIALGDHVAPGHHLDRLRQKELADRLQSDDEAHGRHLAHRGEQPLGQPCRRRR